MLVWFVAVSATSDVEKVAGSTVAATEGAVLPPRSPAFFLFRILGMLNIRFRRQRRAAWEEIQSRNGRPST